jgi:hypothetical protein
MMDASPHIVTPTKNDLEGLLRRKARVASLLNNEVYDLTSGNPPYIIREHFNSEGFDMNLQLFSIKWTSGHNHQNKLICKVSDGDHFVYAVIVPQSTLYQEIINGEINMYDIINVNHYYVLVGSCRHRSVIVNEGTLLARCDYIVGNPRYVYDDSHITTNY